MNRFAKGFGILVAFSFLVGCSDDHKVQFRLLVLDQEKLLAPSTVQELESLSYPPDIGFAIVTMGSISPISIGVEADEMFDKVTEAHPSGEAFEKRGVLLVVSRNPALVQVRVGEELYAPARWGGVIAGERYLARQLLADSGNLDLATIEMAKGLIADLPKAMELPWYKKSTLQNLSSEAASELDELSFPSEGFYGHFLLRPLIQLRIAERILWGSWWVTFAMVALFCALLKYVIEGTLESAFENSKHPRVARTLQRVLTGLTSIALAIPSAASAILLSGARTEDRIALHATGLPGAAVLPFSADRMQNSTGILLAIVLLLIHVLKGVVDRAWLLPLIRLPSAKQAEIYEKIVKTDPLHGAWLFATGSGLGSNLEFTADEFQKAPLEYAFYRPLLGDLKRGALWGLFGFFFLPRQLTLAVIYFAAVPIAIGIYEAAKSFKLAPAVRMSTGTAAVLLFLVPGAAYIVIRAGTSHSDNSAPTTFAAGQDANDNRIVQQNGARVRSRASLDGQQITKLRSGQRVKVTGVQGEWLHVEIYIKNRRVTGWMHKSLFEQNPAANTNKVAQASGPTDPSPRQNAAPDSTHEPGNSAKDSADGNIAMPDPQIPRASTGGDSEPDAADASVDIDQLQDDQQSLPDEPSPAPSLPVDARAEPSQAEPPPGTTIDFHNGLMWMKTDNGEEIDWEDAEEYCDKLTFGDFEDWRLPTLREALSLYARASDAPSWSRRSGAPRFGIELTSCCVWTSTLDRKSRPLFYSNNYGKSGRIIVRAIDLPQIRALCVRSLQQ